MPFAMKWTLRLPNSPLFKGNASIGIFSSVMQRRMEQATALWSREAKILTPVDTSFLRNSEFAEVQGGIRASVTGIVGATAGYARDVEEGTPPHRVSPRKLQGWARRKGFPALAFIAADAIAKRGTKGRKMFARSFEKVRPQIIRIFHDALSEIRRRLEGK